MKLTSLALFAALSAPTAAEIYLKEQFNDGGWTKRWTEPTKWKPKSEMGKWKQSAGQWYADKDDRGLQTTEELRFYGLSAPLEKPFISTEGKDLIIQYTVKHEQKVDCAGAYIKLLPAKTFDQDSFGGDTPYALMFGPDICGGGNKRTHVIINYDKKNENLKIKKDIPCETDQLSHLYTIILKADNTFDVLIDNKSVRKGKLQDHFDFLEPEKIPDPDASKPDDWVDEAKIPDPDDKKPDDWEDVPAEIPDPDAKKPDDWDDEDDGEWEPPLIDNPAYKGEWKQKMIDNPAYKGKWVHPKITNPDFVYDPDMHKICKESVGGCSHVGFELWQVKAGTIIDDIIVTDSLEEAEKFAKATFFEKKDKEKTMHDKVQEEQKNAKKTVPEDDDEMDDEDMDMDGFGDEF